MGYKIVTPLRTPLITTREPPSSNLGFGVWGSWIIAILGFRDSRAGVGVTHGCALGPLHSYHGIALPCPRHPTIGRGAKLQS